MVNEEVEGKEECWVLEWVLTEYDLLPGINNTFWNMFKGSILYVGGKKPGPCPKSWRGQVV